jgi:hypothetical protein
MGQKEILLTAWLREDGTVSGCVMREVGGWTALGKHIKPRFAQSVSIFTVEVLVVFDSFSCSPGVVETVALGCGCLLSGRIGCCVRLLRRVRPLPIAAFPVWYLLHVLKSWRIYDGPFGRYTSTTEGEFL